MIWASEPTTFMRNTIFKLKADSWKYRGTDSLKEGILGVIKSYTYGDEIDNYIKNTPDRVQVTAGSAALEGNVRKLLAKRVRFIIDDETIVRHILKTMDVQDEIEAVHRASEVPLYFGFSPKNPEAVKFAELTSKTLLQMKTDGSLAKIFARYGATCADCR